MLANETLSPVSLMEYLVGQVNSPPGARFGAVAFVHRFGSYLNSHVHFHVIVSDGVFSAGADDTAIFHPALHLPGFGSDS